MEKISGLCNLLKGYWMKNGRHNLKFALKLVHPKNKMFILERGSSRKGMDASEFIPRCRRAS